MNKDCKVDKRQKRRKERQKEKGGCYELAQTECVSLGLPSEYGELEMNKERERKFVRERQRVRERK